MLLVIDANAVIAALLTSKGKTAELLFSEELSLIAPEFILDEIEEHKDEIMARGKFSDEEFGTLLALIQKRITFISIWEFEDSLDEAYRITPDEDDAAYLALALKQECGVWSNDKKIKKQGKVKIFATHELVQKFSKKE